jgi:phage head maturation protease
MTITMGSSTANYTLTSNLVGNIDHQDLGAVAPFVAPPTYRRSASTTIEVVDEDHGVMLGRIFPIGETAPIHERGADGKVLDYDEHFMPGCTERLRQVIDRVGAHFLRLQLGHEEPGVTRHLGYGTALEERADGAYGTFQLYTKRNDYALVREMLGTAWKGLSVAFADRVPPVVEIRGDRPLVGRRQIDLEHIAAVAVPAYASAGVMSIRESAGAVPDPGTPDLDAALALLAELRAESAARPVRLTT